MFEKILVAVDGSQQSDAAFDLAVDIGKKYDSEVIVLSVYVGGLEGRTIVSTEYEDDRRLDAEQILDSYLNRQTQRQSHNLRPMLRKGDPAHQILDTAISLDCGLIILGSRGRGSFKELLLGSVSHKVSNHAGCTVLIVK